MICSGSNVTLPAPRYTYHPTLSPYTWRRRPRPVDCGSEEIEIPDGAPNSFESLFVRQAVVIQPHFLGLARLAVSIFGQAGKHRADLAMPVRRTRLHDHHRRRDNQIGRSDRPASRVGVVARWRHVGRI